MASQQREIQKQERDRLAQERVAAGDQTAVVADVEQVELAPPVTSGVEEEVQDIPVIDQAAKEDGAPKIEAPQSITEWKAQ